MLRGLRLRTGLVSSNKEKSRVHNCSSSKHGSHEDIVTGAINEGYMSEEEEVTLAVFTSSIILLT